MLRTIALRNQTLQSGIKKSVRSNITRCLSTQLTRRKHQNKLLNDSNRKSIPAAQSFIQIRFSGDYPDHIKVNLPALSPTMETGTIVSWEKKEGDKLSEGDLLCEIETDKATMGFETPEEGYLAKIIIQAGTKGVPVGKLLCIIVPDKESVAKFKDFKDDSPDPPPKPKKEDKTSEKAASAAPSPSPPSQSTPSKSTPSPAPAAAAPSSPPPAAASPKPTRTEPSTGRVYASPMAARLAEMKQIRLQGPGSGLYGSVKSGDLESEEQAQASAKPAPTGTLVPGQTYVDIPLSRMRETIAKRLTASKQQIPHYQLAVTVNIEKTMLVRESVNKRLAKEKSPHKLSINDYIIKAVAAACKRVPTVNAHWMEDYIRQFSAVDVSVAVATETGLITPIIRHADSRGILDISESMKALADRAKHGRLQLEEYQGGTVTISNLGMYGITNFNAIINPPQSLILACGGLQELVVPCTERPEGWRVGKFVTFTASCDHRVIDGAVGAVWMAALKQNLEDPTNTLL